VSALRGLTPTRELPVLAASDRPPSNLPPVGTSFVGRAADLAALTQALDPTTRHGTRLLTLSGLAGCGKTRLALAVVKTVRDAYADAVWLVELVPLPASPSADPTTVAAAVLIALGLLEQTSQNVADTLAMHPLGRVQENAGASHPSITLPWISWRGAKRYPESSDYIARLDAAEHLAGSWG
jgi:hypothetical protein